MRIAYIHPASLPSTEANSVHVMNMCEGLALNGHEVMLLVPGREPRMNLHDWYGVQPNFRIGFAWLNIGQVGGTHAFTAAAMGRAALKRTDLIYTRNVIAARIATFLGFSTILELHIPPSAMPTRNRARLKQLLGRGKLLRIVVISGALRALFEHQLPTSAGKLFVAHDCTRLGEPSAGTDNGRFKAVYAGSFYKGRGIEQILLLARITPEFDYVLVGGDAAQLSEIVGEQEIPGNLSAIGHRPPSEIPDILRTADALLAPYQAQTMLKSGTLSTADYMSPLKIFEYMGSGVPIICSDLPVLREVVTDGETALLVKPDAIDEWAAALRRLQSDAALRRRVADRARAEAVAKYSWTGRARAILHGICPQVPAPSSPQSPSR